MSNLTVREFSTPEVELIKRSIAPNASPQEFELFLYRCKHMDLDPLKPGEIYFIKYGSSPGTIVVGIEGFRKRAERSGKRSGIKRGVLRDEQGKCVGAWCEVYRNDWTQPAREEVSLSEYNTGKSQWAKMPETMIKKVAEAAALRLAFPDELGGIYIREEMDQADPEQVRDVAPVQSVESSASENKTPYPSSYPEHLKGRFIEDFSTDELLQAADSLAKWKSGKSSASFRDVQQKAYDYILHLMNKNSHERQFDSELDAALSRDRT